MDTLSFFSTIAGFATAVCILVLLFVLRAKVRSTIIKIRVTQENAKRHYQSTNEPKIDPFANVFDETIDTIESLPRLKKPEPEVENSNPWGNTTSQREIR